MGGTTSVEDSVLLEQATRAVELAQRVGADDCSVSIQQGRDVELAWREGRLEKVQESAGMALTAALYVDGRYSAHYSNDLRPEALQAFLEGAVELTRALEPDPHRQMPDPALYEGRSEADLQLLDPALDDVTRDTMLGWLKEMDAASTGDERVISATSSLSIGRGMSARATSNGFAGTHQGGRLTGFCEVTVQDQDGRRPEDYEYACARFLEDMPALPSIGHAALARALSRLSSTKAESLKTTMVLDPRAAGSFIGRIFGALSASAIQQERSFLRDALNTQVGSAVLGIVDDPLMLRGLRSHAYDGEGIASRPRTVFEDGVLRTYFVDTYYGRKLGWKPTTGGTSNLRFEGTTTPRDELLGRIDEGIYITSWAGGNADLTNGEFSFGIRGHRIRAGVLAEPVSEMNITGSYGELLERLVAVGDDPYPYSSVRTPTLVFDGIQFSGA